jgi:hypothetical protein
MVDTGKSYRLWAMLVIAGIVCMSCASSGPRKTLNRIAFSGFTVQDIDMKIKRSADEEIMKSLINLMGEKCYCVVHRRGEAQSMSANRQMVGTLSKMGSGIMVSVRVIDGEKGVVLFNASRMAKTAGDLNEVLSGIAEDVSRSDEIW